MFNIGPEELLLVLVIALVVFGPKRLPELARTIGKSLREFRRASEGIRDEITRHLDLEEDDGFAGTFPAEHGKSDGTSSLSTGSQDPAPASNEDGAGTTGTGSAA